MDRRRDDRSEAHTVLSYLAARTGGLFMKNRNDLGCSRTNNGRSRGYYLGYRPDDAQLARHVGCESLS